MKLDKQHPLPVYLQLKEMLRNQIERGLYFSHQKLPSERDLCQQHNLSRMTARRALKALIAEGFAYTRIGKGTFVSHRTGDSASKKLTPKSYEKVSYQDAAKGSFISTCERRLVEQLLAFNSVGTEQVINEALASYAIETVALKIFPEVIRQCEQEWRKGKISLLRQNYAASTLRSQLIAMVSATTVGEIGPRVVVACAPGDQHDIGLLMFTLSLRRRGCVVVNLDSHGRVSEFQQVIQIIQPELVCFSASTTSAAVRLAAFSRHYHQSIQLISPDEHWPEGKQAVLTFGGVAFTRNPALVSSVPGVYLGDSVEAAVTTVEKLLL